MDKRKYPWNHIADKFRKNEPEIQCVYAGPEMAQKPPCEGVYAGPSPNDPRLMQAVYAGPEYYNPTPTHPPAGEYISPERFEEMKSSVIANTSPEVFHMIDASLPNGNSGVKYCASCGNPLPDGARFCPECGTPCTKPEDSNA